MTDATTDAMTDAGPRITVDALNRKIADPATPEEELARYLLRDEARSGPFDPALALNPATVEVPAAPAERARADVALASANELARLRRRMAFETRLALGYDGPIIVSEGDSWFQYPLRLRDVIDHLAVDYAVRSLDAAGDTLQHMYESGEYLPAIQETRASVFLFSGGGNDVLGGGNLAEHLRPFDPKLSPADHVLPSYRDVLDHAIALYDRIFRSVEDAPGEVLTLCHGYDHVVPNRGRWLGRPMEKRDITDPAFQKRITDTLVDRFNARLKVLADGFPRVTYLDLRGTVGDRWDDELHPTSAAFGDVAEHFRTAIRAMARPRPVQEVAAARQVLRSCGSLRLARGAGDEAPAEEQVLVRELAAPALPRRGRTGLSLHIGLNEIDPAHYGSSGKLNACEFDAEAMQGIAEGCGFAGRTYLNGRTGTRAALIAGIEDAARQLRAGDIFLLTYAGHGSQVPDFNKDEGDDPEGLDETFCLYDAMFIDDELYGLWRGFADDVRVLVVSDSCHSGSVIRAAGRPGDFVEPEEPPVRYLHAGRALHANKAFYRALYEHTRDLNEGVLVKELSFPLRCSVVLLAGCQDNQLSRDGVMNGRFTQELLTVWRDGQFDGDYARFLRTIRKGMPSTQSPNLMSVGRPNPAFMGQKPFSI